MEDSSSKRKRGPSISDGIGALPNPHQQQRSDQDPYSDNADPDADRNIHTRPTQQQPEEPWYTAFPPPTMAVDSFPRQRLQMMLSMRIASVLIVDVRRVDYAGGAIRGSLNVPAQGFWWNRGMLYELAYKSDMEWVIFTCGSSRGRGPRCAAWFLEHVRNTAGDTNMHVSVLEGGIKGWIQAGPQYIQLMDGFDVGHWEKVFAEEARAARESAAQTGDGMVA